ncbi:MAG: TrmH family RNA methyltransferase [Planctomycetota bacterium]
MREFPPVTSRRNPIVQQFRRARDGADPSHFVVEGVRFIEEAAAARAELEVVLVSEELVNSDRVKPIIEKLQQIGVDVRHAADPVLDAVSFTETSQGISALARRKSVELKAIFNISNPFVVVAAGISDPGNLGTLLRTANAAGATGFVVLKDSVSPWNDKALRASAGSIFRLPVAANVKFTEMLPLIRQARARLVATSAVRGEIYYQFNMKPPIVLILGNEGFGVSEEVRSASDAFVKIPLAAGVESLNVAAAGAILCFEAARQSGIVK